MSPQFVNEMTKVMTDYESSGQLVRSVSDAMDCCKKHGVSMSMRITPSDVGVHYDNRDGLGCNSHDVHSLLSAIYEVGWVDGETNPICVQLDEVDGKRCHTFNDNLCSTSDGKLPLYAHAPRFASLSSSHTNQALRCLAEGVKHDDERMCNEPNVLMSMLVIFLCGMVVCGNAQAACKHCSVLTRVRILNHTRSNMLRQRRSTFRREGKAQGRTAGRAVREWTELACHPLFTAEAVPTAWIYDPSCWELLWPNG